MRHPEYYLGRADEARAMAQATVDAKARDVLIKCAEEYEGLAKQATVQKSEELADRIKRLVLQKRAINRDSPARAPQRLK